MIISAEKLKFIRQRRGWTQTHLSEAAGLSLRTVQRLEGEGRGASESILSICAVLEMTVDELARPLQEQPTATKISPSYLALWIFIALIIGCLIGIVVAYNIWI